MSPLPTSPARVPGPVEGPGFDDDMVPDWVVLVLDGLDEVFWIHLRSDIERLLY